MKPQLVNYYKLNKAIIILTISVIVLSCNKKVSRLQSFPYGVASGNPSSEGFLIWTKIDSNLVDKKINWLVATDSLFSNIEKKGTTNVLEDSDGSIKLVVDGLKPSTTYYYKFSVNKNESPLGRTKTLPDFNDMPENYNIAFVSCNNYQDGYFNSFESLSKRDDIDLVVHLGDYIYEYEAGTYADTTLADRAHLPANEIVSLNDYRTRYRQYRSDPQLQKVHAKFPFLFIWDDHEFANDSYKYGAKNHSSNEGEWNKRKNSAEKAYMEWMPIEKSPSVNAPYTLSIGQLMELVLLEERTTSRTKQIDPCEGIDTALEKTHTLLGDNQINKLENIIINNKKPWTVIANQVAFSGYAKTDSLFQLKYQDWWLGYPNDRKKVLTALSKAKNRPIILTGDHHRSFIMAVQDELIEQNPCNPKYNTSYQTNPMAWEVMIPSITSKNHDIYPDSLVNAYTQKLTNPKDNPHIKFADLKSHGYVVMHFNKNNVQAEYVFTESIKKRDIKNETIKIYSLKN